MNPVQKTELIQKLSRLDSCAVSDAMDSLKLPPAVSGISRRAGTQTIAGEAITVRLGPATDEPAKTGNVHLCAGAIEAGGPGTVIVVEQKTGIDAGGWGGVLSQAAHQRGIEGVVVDGPARDIDESRAIGFAVFARSTTARTARGRIREMQWGGSVTIGDQQVQSGDLIIADDSGVVILPIAQAPAIIATAQRIADKEAAMVQAILSGKPVTEVMGANYENMLRQQGQ